MQNLIDAFNEKRTIVYKIVPINYTLETPCELCNSNSASCTPKHIVLAHKFNQMGYQTRFCVHQFYWSDLNFPKILSELMVKFSSDFHTNLEINIENNWIMVDATWDDLLLNAGLPGTKIWNGRTFTVNCVKSYRSHIFDTIRSRNDYLLKEKSRKSFDRK